MERLLIYFYAYELFSLLRLHVVEADAILSHQLNSPRSSASVDTGQGLADNRSLQNPLILLGGFVVWK